MSFVIYSFKTGTKNVGTKIFLQIYKILSNFDFNLLICDATLFLGKNSQNIAKSNRVFPGKGRGDRALILTYLDGPMTEVFPHYCLSFPILAIISEKRVVKVGSKLQTLGPSLFHENSNLSIFFKQCFCLKIVAYVISYTGYASLVKILLKFELIKAHLSSFKLFSAYVGLLI